VVCPKEEVAKNALARKKIRIFIEFWFRCITIPLLESFRGYTSSLQISSKTIQNTSLPRDSLSRE
jgi:hypothetical protein